MIALLVVLVVILVAVVVSVGVGALVGWWIHHNAGDDDRVIPRAGAPFADRSVVRPVFRAPPLEGPQS